MPLKRAMSSFYARWPNTIYKGDEYEVLPGVAVFIPKNYVHWFRNLIPDQEGEICGVYSAPNAGEYKPEDYKYLGEIIGKDKKLK
jgi:hypothetical protein